MDRQIEREREKQKLCKAISRAQSEREKEGYCRVIAAKHIEREREREKKENPFERRRRGCETLNKKVVLFCIL